MHSDNHAHNHNELIQEKDVQTVKKLYSLRNNHQKTATITDEQHNRKLTKKDVFGPDKILLP